MAYESVALDGRADRVLDALGSPTRRSLLRLLRGTERTVRDLTDHVDVTQPAVSQHLKVLDEAGLVTVRASGRRRLYSVDLDGLGAVRAWVDGFWDDVLEAFADHVDEVATGTATDDTAHPTEDHDR